MHYTDPRTNLTLDELRNMLPHLEHVNGPDSVGTQYVHNRITELEDQDTRVA